MPDTMPPQAEIDALNARFWDELCGSTMARGAGVTDDSAESLRRFDAAYMGFYPYLERYLPAPSPSGRVLEIGLGYGTLSQLLAERIGDYHGLDIAPGPVQMVRHRLNLMGIGDPERRVRQGSALAIPHPEKSFDYVYTVGCLHHTGDVPRAVAEVRRVLAPGGRLLVMLYNRHSLRRLLMMQPREFLQRDRDAEQRARGRYDINSAGQAAPTTEFISVREAKRLFSWCEDLRIERQNFDSYSPHVLRGRVGFTIPRERLLGSAARVAGLDLYITGRK